MDFLRKKGEDSRKSTCISALFMINMKCEKQSQKSMAEAAAVPTDRRYITMKKIGLFAAGVLFGTAGLKILGSREAKKVYTGVTAAALRAKDCVMGAVTTVRENAEDIYADAKELNERRAAELAEEVVEDTAETPEEAAETPAE